MNSREKILVVASAVALVWGGLMVLFPGGSSKKTENRKNEDVTSFIAQVTEAVSPGPSGKRDGLILGRARSPWGENPFLDTGALNFGESKIQLSYQGFVRTGGKAYALINNREYRVGEMLEGTEILVKSISEHQVVLIELGRKKRILPLEKGL